MNACPHDVLPTAGQYLSFDSSHIWETGIQTYLAGLQHLPISPAPSHPAHYPPNLHPLDPHNSPTTRDPAQKEHTTIFLTTVHQQDIAAATSWPRHVQSALSKSDPHGVESSVPTNKVPPSPLSPASHASALKQLGAGGGVPTPPGPAEVDLREKDSSSLVSSNLQSSTVRYMYLCLAAHNGSALDSFLQGVPDPSEWEVFVWQAPQGPSQGGAAAQHYLQVARQWQEEVSQFVSFAQAAGEVQCGSHAQCARHVFNHVEIPHRLDFAAITACPKTATPELLLCTDAGVMLPGRQRFFMSLPQAT